MLALAAQAAMRFQKLHRLAPGADERADAIAGKLRAQCADHFADAIFAALFRADGPMQHACDRDQERQRDISVLFQRFLPLVARVPSWAKPCRDEACACGAG